MTINNKTYAQPNIALVIFRALGADPGPHTLDDLYAICAPPAAIAAASVSSADFDPEGTWRTGIKESVEILTDFRIVESKGGQHRLAESLEPIPPHETDRRYLARELRQRFLDPDQNKDLWSSDKGPRDFTRVITWYLLQNIEGAPRNFTDVAPLQRRQLAGGSNVQAMMKALPSGSREDYLVTNTRWPVFERWAVFTGLARRDVGGLLPDPTAAVAGAIKSMSSRERMPAYDFIALLAESLPVVDSGTYWRSVIDEFDEATRNSLRDRLSPSLSHALLRLADQGLIELDNRADAPDKTRFSDGTQSVLISHVEVKG